MSHPAPRALSLENGPSGTASKIEEAAVAPTAKQAKSKNGFIGGGGFVLRQKRSFTIRVSVDDYIPVGKLRDRGSRHGALGSLFWLNLVVYCRTCDDLLEEILRLHLGGLDANARGKRSDEIPFELKG